MTYVSADQEAILQAAAADPVKAVIVGAYARRLAEDNSPAELTRPQRGSPINGELMMAKEPVKFDEQVVTPEVAYRWWPWATLAAFIVALLFLLPSNTAMQPDVQVNRPASQQR